MKKFVIPTAIFSVMFALIALAVVFSTQGQVTVSETVSVSPTNLDVSLEPNSNVTKTVQVNNTGSTSVDVLVTGDVVSSLGGPIPGVSLTLSPTQPMTISPGSSATATFTISADNGVPPDTGTFTVEVFRP